VHQKVTTNDKGFFQLEVDTPHDSIGWHSYEVRVPTMDLQKRAEYKICDEESTGVISDIDDTLLVSHSSIDWRKLYTYLSKSTNKRKPTAALNEILQHLSVYNQGVGTADYFYVSNSEWNLYEFLLAFFDLNEIPKGVYLLNSIIHHPLDFLRRQGKSEVEGHKLRSIQQLLDVFPQKSFVLIGDTAQHDTELFQRVLKNNSQQIKAVLLREIKDRHAKKYADLKQSCEKNGITFKVYDA
jgi:phosphatidate phosphatase APP1